MSPLHTVFLQVSAVNFGLYYKNILTNYAVPLDKSPSSAFMEKRCEFS